MHLKCYNFKGEEKLTMREKSVCISESVGFVEIRSFYYYYFFTFIALYMYI